LPFFDHMLEQISNTEIWFEYPSQRGFAHWRTLHRGNTMAIALGDAVL
jgi:imidazoleglycerol phosphate dehydratase HisB